MNQSRKPLSEIAAHSTNRGCLFLFFLVFFLMGSGFLTLMFIRPAWQVLAARSWPATPCTILSSQVVTNDDSDGDTYGVAIRYAYSFNGRTYQSERYDFAGLSTSNYSSKHTIVDYYRPGRQTTCYVNPAQPAQAVLNRSFNGDYWFSLVPLIFVFVGGGGMVYAYRSRSQPPRLSTLPRASFGWGRTAAKTAEPVALGWPVTLKPKQSPLTKLIAMTIFSLLWNGIVSVFLWVIIESWLDGRPEKFLAVFMIPFVLVGLGTLGGVVYFALGLFNPRPTLMLNATEIPLGGSLRLQWQIDGRLERITHLRLLLEGREEATYSRGTSTYTDKETFYTKEVFATTQPMQMHSGSANVTLPRDSMYSFAGAANKIIWFLRLHGDIRRWPDLEEEFEITVRPVQL